MNDLAVFTRDQLYTLHQQLSDEHNANHRRLMDDDTHKPRVSPFSDEWAVLRAKGDELYEAAEAVYAEIQRRNEQDWDVAKPAMQPRITDA